MEDVTRIILCQLWMISILYLICRGCYNTPGGCVYKMITYKVPAVVAEHRVDSNPLASCSLGESMCFRGRLKLKYESQVHNRTWRCDLVVVDGEPLKSHVDKELAKYPIGYAHDVYAISSADPSYDSWDEWCLFPNQLHAQMATARWSFAGLFVLLLPLMLWCGSNVANGTMKCVVHWANRVTVPDNEAMLVAPFLAVVNNDVVDEEKDLEMSALLP